VGEFYRRAACEVVLEGGRVVVMEQVIRGSRSDKGKGGLLPATMAVGALERGVGGGASAHGGGHACGGTGEWWGR
jgi:hypothetical protein